MTTTARDLTAYRNDPVGFCRDVLDVTLWSAQSGAAERLMQGRHRVIMQSAHNVGKTFLSACLTVWWYYTRPRSVVITTAPTLRDVVDLLWTEVRLLVARGGLPDHFIGPSAPEMRDPAAPQDHWAKGYTASKGESLDAETRIDTPDGVRRFGDLMPGDWVFGADGEPTRVISVHPNGIRPAYEVTTSAGQVVVADEKHIWKVKNVNNGARGWLAKKYGRRKPEYELLTTEQIIERGVSFSQGGRSRSKFQLPESGAVNYPYRPVPVPAYTMGVWLGDGTCFNGGITSADFEMRTFLSDDNGIESTCRSSRSGSKAMAMTVPGLQAKLREMGLLGGKTESKRVLRCYMENSESIRLAVLQGLMDTDGTAGSTGICSFSCTSKGLVEDVAWLARSLGLRSKIASNAKIKKRTNGGDYKPMYTVSIRNNGTPLFRLKRKAERIESVTNPAGLMIGSIKPCGLREMVCITVSADDGLFLANDFVVTHNSFQGRHRESMLFVFDEAEGLDKAYWTTTSTMHQPGQDHAWLAICNPTTTTSQRYIETRALDFDGGKKWDVLSVSAMDHPNLPAGLAGTPLPYPNAVTVEQVEQWLGEWFEPVGDDDKDPDTDVEYPPASGKWWRPGPDGEARVLGRNPSAGTYGVWSENLWRRACGWGRSEPLVPSLADIPEIGADIARFGDDRTEIHTRHGPVSVWHEDHGGWDTVRTADRLMEMADEWAAWITSQRAPQAAPIEGRAIPVKVDDTGVGGGVTDILVANGYAAVAVNAGSAASDDSKYPRVRDELWFTVAAMAKAGELDLSRLPAKIRARLEIQALAPTWQPTPDRRRRVESKEETKKRIGRSPDGMDAVNLAYYSPGASAAVAEWVGGVAKRRGFRSE